MNERIQALAEQTGSYIKQNLAGQVVYQFNTDELEEFTHSIIQECADLFTLTFTDEQYQRRIDKTIRKHFGVEE